MTVLNVAYPFAKVREDTAGGAEQIVRLLDSALSSAGINSVVVARSGSQVSGQLHTLGLDSHLNPVDKNEIYKQYRLTIESAIRSCSPDVVHMHGIDFINYLPETNLPVLITLHLPINWYPPEALRIQLPNIYYNCVSYSQHKDIPSDCNYLPPILNGVEVEKFSYSKQKRKYAVCLGRVCPEKGYHLALKAAKKAGIPLVIAGEVYDHPEHVNYFLKVVEPELDDTKYKFIGRVNFTQKNKLLSEACCLLLPSLAKETSSLAAMESLSSGTPVIGFNTGALSEIIKQGETGFLVEDTDQMSERISNVNSIIPENCRREAEEKYSWKVMTDHYINTYSQLTGGGIGN